MQRRQAEPLGQAQTISLHEGGRSFAAGAIRYKKNAEAKSWYNQLPQTPWQQQLPRQTPQVQQLPRQAQSPGWLSLVLSAPLLHTGSWRASSFSTLALSRRPLQLRLPWLATGTHVHRLLRKKTATATATCAEENCHGVST